MSSLVNVNILDDDGDSGKGYTLNSGYNPTAPSSPNPHSGKASGIPWSSERTRKENSHSKHHRRHTVPRTGPTITTLRRSSTPSTPLECDNTSSYEKNVGRRRTSTKRGRNADALNSYVSGNDKLGSPSPKQKKNSKRYHRYRLSSKLAWKSFGTYSSASSVDVDVDHQEDFCSSAISHAISCPVAIENRGRTFKSNDHAPPGAPKEADLEKSQHDTDEDDYDDMEIPYAQCFDGTQSRLRSELSDARTEPLRPGDIICYFHPAFVAGHTEARRITQVLRIHDDDKNVDVTEDSCPLELANGDILTADIRIRRIREYRKGRLLLHAGISRPIHNFLYVASALPVSERAVPGRAEQIAGKLEQWQHEMRQELFNQTLTVNDSALLSDDENGGDMPDHNADLKNSTRSTSKVASNGDRNPLDAHSSDDSSSHMLARAHASLFATRQRHQHSMVPRPTYKDERINQKQVVEKLHSTQFSLSKLPWGVGKAMGLNSSLSNHKIDTGTILRNEASLSSDTDSSNEDSQKNDGGRNIGKNNDQSSVATSYLSSRKESILEEGSKGHPLKCLMASHSKKRSGTDERIGLSLRVPTRKPSCRHRVFEVSMADFFPETVTGIKSTESSTVQSHNCDDFFSGVLTDGISAVGEQCVTETSSAVFHNRLSLKLDSATKENRAAKQNYLLQKYRREKRMNGQPQSSPTALKSTCTFFEKEEMSIASSDSSDEVDLKRQQIEEFNSILQAHTNSHATPNKRKRRDPKQVRLKPELSSALSISKNVQRKKRVSAFRQREIEYTSSCQDYGSSSNSSEGEVEELFTYHKNKKAKKPAAKESEYSSISEIATSQSSNEDRATEIGKNSATSLKSARRPFRVANRGDQKAMQLTLQSIPRR